MYPNASHVSRSHSVAEALVLPREWTTGHRQEAVRGALLSLARFEMRHLKQLFEDFDHDILLPILLGEIALHNIGALESRDGTCLVRRPSGNSGLCQLRPCNAYSIAAATGLPRETVRRKIARLVELGWIRRRHNGHLYVTSEAVRHFGHLLRSRDMPELLQTAEQLRRLLGE